MKSNEEYLRLKMEFLGMLKLQFRRFVHFAGSWEEYEHREFFESVQKIITSIKRCNDGLRIKIEKRNQENALFNSIIGAIFRRDIRAIEQLIKNI